MEMKKKLQKNISETKVKTRINSSANLSQEVVDYGFFGLQNLKEMEDGIQRAVAIGQRTSLAICLALYNIKEKKLYIQEGFENYNQYLKAERFMPYASAMQFTYIGHKWVEYQKELHKVDFSEQDGILKLKYLPPNFSKLKEETKTKILLAIKSETSILSFRKEVSEILGKKSKALKEKKPPKKKKNLDILTVSEFFGIGYNRILISINGRWDRKSEGSLFNILQENFNQMEEHMRQLLEAGKIQIYD